MSGYCTKNYRKVERSVCQLEPGVSSRHQFLRDRSRGWRGRRRSRRPGGTVAPLVTISLLIFSCCCGVLCWRFKQQMLSLLGHFVEKNKSLERRPSISELEMMDVDPFKSQFQNVKTFSVQDRKSFNQ